MSQGEAIAIIVMPVQCGHRNPLEFKCFFFFLISFQKLTCFDIIYILQVYENFVYFTILYFQAPYGAVREKTARENKNC